MKAINSIIFVFFISFSNQFLLSDKNSLNERKLHPIEHLKEKEALNPVVFKNAIPKSYIKSVTDFTNDSNYYSQLYNNGYLTTQLRKDTP